MDTNNIGQLGYYIKKENLEPEIFQHNDCIMSIFEGKWNRRIPHIHPLSFFPRGHRPPTTTTLASSFLPKATPPPLRWSRKQPRMDDSSSSSSSSSSSRWVGEKEEEKLCQECAIRLSLVPAAEMGERERESPREGGRVGKGIVSL